jgi:hypothetical protein
MGSASEREALLESKQPTKPLSIKGGEKEAAVGKTKDLSLILILMKSEA